MNRPTKIIVAGMSGSGKTTLAEAIGKNLGLPVHHADEFCFDRNKNRKPVGEIKEYLNNILAGDSWVVDGIMSSEADDFAGMAQLLIYIEINLIANLRNIIKRKIVKILKSRSTGGNQGENRIHLVNTRRVLFTRKSYKEKWMKAIDNLSGTTDVMFVKHVNNRNTKKIISQIKQYN